MFDKNLLFHPEAPALIPRVHLQSHPFPLSIHPREPWLPSKLARSPCSSSSRPEGITGQVVELSEEVQKHSQALPALERADLSYHLELSLALCFPIMTKPLQPPWDHFLDMQL